MAPKTRRSKEGGAPKEAANTSQPTAEMAFHAITSKPRRSRVATAMRRARNKTPSMKSTLAQVVTAIAELRSQQCQIQEQVQRQSAPVPTSSRSEPSACNQGYNIEQNHPEDQLQNQNTHLPEPSSSRSEPSACRAVLSNPINITHDLPAESDDGIISDSDDASVVSEGECEVTYAKQRPVLAGGLSVGQTVPMKIKKKIWKKQFVDFSELLNPHSPSHTYSCSLDTDLASNKPTLAFTSKSKKVLGENEWNLAWDTYVSVYLQKYPGELQAMLTYHQNVTKLMLRKAYWRDYDIQFRIDREYSNYPWDIVRTDLERDAYYSGNNNNQFFGTKPSNFRNSNAGNSFRGQAAKVPKGYCFAYNQPHQHCTNARCTYKHACPTCNEGHPGYVHGKQGDYSRKPAVSNAKPDTPRGSK